MTEAFAVSGVHTGALLLLLVVVQMLRCCLSQRACSHAQQWVLRGV